MLLRRKNAMYELQIVGKWLTNDTGTQDMCWEKLRAYQWTDAPNGYWWLEQHCLCQQGHIYMLESDVGLKCRCAEHTV